MIGISTVINDRGCRRIEIELPSSSWARSFFNSLSAIVEGEVENDLIKQIHDVLTLQWHVEKEDILGTERSQKRRSSHVIMIENSDWTSLIFEHSNFTGG